MRVRNAFVLDMKSKANIENMDLCGVSYNIGGRIVSRKEREGAILGVLSLIICRLGLLGQHK